MYSTRPFTDADIMNIVTNGGAQHYATIGAFKLLTVEHHYNNACLANILSLKDYVLLPGVRITMDTTVERDIFVSLNDGKRMKFQGTQ